MCHQRDTLAGSTPGHPCNTPPGRHAVMSTQEGVHGVRKTSATATGIYVERRSAYKVTSSRSSRLTTFPQIRPGTLIQQNQQHLTRKVYRLQVGIATYTGVVPCREQAPQTSFFGSSLGQHEAGPSPPSSSKRSRSPMMPRA